MLINAVAEKIFKKRLYILCFFALITLFLFYKSTQLTIDEGFEKQLPLKHPYVETFLEYQEQFGNADRILIALQDRSGNMFNAHFFDVLKKVTDEVFFLEDVDKARVKSIFTPNVRYIEIVEDGFAGGNVIPRDFTPTENKLQDVKENIIKAGIVGRLVANDFSGAIVSASLIDKKEGEDIDYIGIANKLEQDIREKYQDDSISIHIIGFTKVVGDIADGVIGVIGFFIIAILIAFILVRFYCQSTMLTTILILCSLTAVIWQMGLLVVMGYGIDPMSILIPFLVFAIAVSHGVQMVNAIGKSSLKVKTSYHAAKLSFEKLAMPGMVALMTDVIGFLTILLIKIPMIQELAITASLGVATILITNILILPLILSYFQVTEKYRKRIQVSAEKQSRIWKKVAVFTNIKVAVPTLLICVCLYSVGAYISRDIVIGDQSSGIPELWPDSRYNMDTKKVSEKFSIGVDVIQVIAEVPANGCIDHSVMHYIDDFDWHMQNIEGVQSTLTLSQIMKRVNAGWNEGAIKWHTLMRTPSVLVRSVTPVETSTGLLNSDCSIIPIMIFTKDHKAETIERVVGAVKEYQKNYPDNKVNLRLATGNVGVMAAINDSVEAAQLPILIWVYCAVILFCLINFRSVIATICTVLPLTLVSVLCTALMVKLNIGLKISTLPVIALGVGIGVDYGIYIFSSFKRHLQNPRMTIRKAYEHTLNETGSAVIFTGLTLSISVFTWIFSALKFQADMGILLSFMFLVNMLAAIIILPSLYTVLIWIKEKWLSRKG